MSVPSRTCVPGEEAENCLTTLAVSAGEQIGGAGPLVAWQDVPCRPARRLRGLCETHMLPLVVSPVSLS